jgi:hypothetical protein
MSRQLPQVAPAPVRIVNSATLRQPASAAWRMSRSVTPLQMHTYMGKGLGRRWECAAISPRMRIIVN